MRKRPVGIRSPNSPNSYYVGNVWSRELISVSALSDHIVMTNLDGKLPVDVRMQPTCDEMSHLVSQQSCCVSDCETPRTKVSDAKQKCQFPAMTTLITVPSCKQLPTYLQVVSVARALSPNG